MSELAARVALVTGASRGIGLAVAARFEAAGARVVRMARSLAPARSERRLDVPCDITRADQLEAAVRTIEASFGIPDLLVNNAGTFLLKPFEQTAPQEFAAQLATNLQGAFQVAHTFLPRLRATGRPGRLITIGSIADHRAFPGNAAYSAAKFGLRGLHQVLREEYRGSGILCSLVSPGATDTDAWNPYDPEHRPELPKRSAMLVPDDVAEAVFWIASRPPHVDIDWLRMGSQRIENRE